MREQGRGWKGLKARGLKGAGATMLWHQSGRDGASVGLPNSGSMVQASKVVFDLKAAPMSTSKQPATVNRQTTLRRVLTPPCIANDTL